MSFFSSRQYHILLSEILLYNSSIMKSIKTPNHPAYHWSTLWPLEVWVRGLYKFWWFCVHKLSMFIYLSMVRTFSYDAIFCHSCLEINKELNWNVLHRRSIKSMLSIYLSKQIFNFSTFNHPQEIRSLYIYKYSVRYVSISWCTLYTTDHTLIK